MFIFLIIGIIVGALVIIFALQNITTISVVFLSWQFEGSLALILVLALVAGMVISSLLSVPAQMKRRAQILKLKSENRELEEKLTNKKIEVEDEKSKLAATNAYVDDLEKNPQA